MATLTFMPKKNFEFEKTYKRQKEQEVELIGETGKVMTSAFSWTTFAIILM